MKINCICFTSFGEQIIEKLKNSESHYDFQKFLKMENRPDSMKRGLKDFAGECFLSNIPLVFVGAMGICVRTIAPFVKDKLYDIPVVVIDDNGQFVIPVLSGHMGGANELTLDLARILGAFPVITTSTDVNSAFSPDMFAKEYGLNIENRDGIKKVAGKALNGEPVVISIKNFPPEKNVDILIDDEENDLSAVLNEKMTGTLRLRRKKYVIGIGCKKDKAFEEIERFIIEKTSQLNIELKDIFCICSIDIKQKEMGIVNFSRKYRIPFVTFDAGLLNKAPGEYEGSKFVKEKTGTDNVCERAAVLGAQPYGNLVLKKCSSDGVTLAIAERF